MNSQKMLEDMLEKKNKLAALKIEKSNLITEEEYFKIYSNEDKIQLSRSLLRLSSEKNNITITAI